VTVERRRYSWLTERMSFANETDLAVQNVGRTVAPIKFSKITQNV
jgi:hypothetical protein